MSLTPRRIELTCAFMSAPPHPNLAGSDRLLAMRTGPAFGPTDRGRPDSPRLEVDRVRGDRAARPRGTPLREVIGAGECVEDEPPGTLDDARDDDLPVRLVTSFACHLLAPSAEVS